MVLVEQFTYLGSALPPAIKARKRAAKGNNPPFYDLFLLIFFFASRFLLFNFVIVFVFWGDSN